MNAAVRMTWAARTAAEYRSASVSAEMLHWCLCLGVAPALVARVHRLVDDELDHAELSRAVHVAAGGSPGDVTVDRGNLALRIAPSEPLGRRALAAAFQEFAVHETLALECFKAMAKADLEPVVRRAVDRIVRDEARHRRLGWELVRALLALTGERAWLESLAPAAIRGVLACYPADTAAPSAGEARWGLLSGAAYASAVASAIRGPINTQLARNGLGAVQARVDG